MTAVQSTQCATRSANSSFLTVPTELRDNELLLDSSQQRLAFGEGGHRPCPGPPCLDVAASTRRDSQPSLRRCRTQEQPCIAWRLQYEDPHQEDGSLPTRGPP